MARDAASTWRPVAVWLVVTVATAVVVPATPATWSGAATAAGVDRAPALLVAGCATALATGLGWLWAITTATVADLLRGRTGLAGGGTTRRLVLLACGAAVAATTTLPAHGVGTGTDGIGADGTGADGAGAEVLVGLPLPERAVAPAGGGQAVPAVTAPRPPSAATVRPTPHPTSGRYVVQAGDSLWSIARAHPVPGIDVDARWRAIWRHNRGIVGDDPDLIHPGQALRLPGPHVQDRPRLQGDPSQTENKDEKDGERR